MIHRSREGARNAVAGGNAPIPILLRKQQNSLFLGLGLLGIWTVVGTLGFSLIEGWSLFDSFYMTILTISSVGYGEVHPLSETGRVFASFVIVLGIGTAIYTFTRLGQVVLEGELQGVLGRKRMQKEVAKLEDHFIVCGFGRIGRPVAFGLETEGYPVCVLEANHELEGDLQATGLLYLIGDATEDSVLQSAGLDRAKAVLALLPSDADNLLLTITAKELSPSVMVIARASEERVESKLKRVGADKIISPYRSACARVLHAAIRPAVVEFLELATHRDYMQLSLEEIKVCDGSPLSGRSLSESQIRAHYGVIVIAIQQADGTMEFNPQASHTIHAKDVLVVVGKGRDLKSLEDDCSGQ
ncbi:MAG: potassium channel protein [Acidobacteriota bacterium]